MKNKVFRRFLRRKVSVAAAIILLTIILACIFGPMFITTDPLEQDILNAYQAPSSAHWFGTDNMGRDIFIRMLYGGRNSLSISFEGVILGTFIGVMLGVCAAMNIFRPAKSWVKVLPVLSLPTSFPTRFRRSSSMSLCSWVPQF